MCVVFWLKAEGHIVETMSWLPLLRPAPSTGGNVCAMASFLPAVGGIGMKATDPKTTAGAQVTISETRKNGKRKHVDGLEGSGGNAQKRGRRTAGPRPQSPKTSSNFGLEDGVNFLPTIGGKLLASGSTRVLPAIGGKSELGRSKGGTAQETAIPQPPRSTSEFRLGGCSFLPNIGGATLAIGSTKVDMTSTGRGQNVLQDQDPTHQTAIILPDIGAKLPVTDGNKCPAIGGKSGLVASNLATGSKNGRRRPSVPSWRPNARDDLPVLASRFGADLLSVPQEWLDMEKAAALLQKHALRLPVAGGKLREFNPGQRIMFWEVYSGCCNATRAFVESASGDHEIAGPPVDIVRKAWFGLRSWNVLLPSVRQFLWAIMVVCQPMWVHCAPPCTFWSSLSRRTNHRSRIEDEDIRLQALVHIVFSLQLCRHQLRQKRWFSFEHPPTASSWNLDLLQELVASGTSQTGPTVVAGNNMLKMEKYIFDSCRWGHQDPGNGKLYRKRQCFASNADLSPLCLRCVCCVRHQVVEGKVDSGPRKGTRRAVVAGEYPWAFCVAWAHLIKLASGGT